MKTIARFLLLIAFCAPSFVGFGQQKPVTTNVPKFKPPAVKTFLGVNQNGAAVTVDEATQLVSLPLKITDDKNNVYKIDSYQFLYRKKSYIRNDESGKLQPAFTIESARFDATPLPKIWVDNIGNGLQKDEQLYFFDILVKDKEGRKFFAPELKITIQ